MAELSETGLRGAEVISKILGPEPAESLRQVAESEKFGAKMTALALELCYADNWNDHGSLSRRERSLILIGALVGLRPDELRNHVRLGLANGIAPEELEEILLHLITYVGFPATSRASRAIRKLLAEPDHLTGRA